MGKVDIIVTGGIAVLAAKQATSVIPIVFAVANDPVGSGLVASLSRPGGNITGLSILAPDLAGKRYELLREVVPGLRRLAILANVVPFSCRRPQPTQIRRSKFPPQGTGRKSWRRA
jgi:putative ABC transport system substrate-binding protein